VCIYIYLYRLIFALIPPCHCIVTAATKRGTHKTAAETPRKPNNIGIDTCAALVSEWSGNMCFSCTEYPAMHAAEKTATATHDFSNVSSLPLKCIMQNDYNADF